MMLPRIHFTGSFASRMQSIAAFRRAVMRASFRRARNGPLRSSWSWSMEVATEVLNERMTAVFHAADVEESRRALDSIQIDFPEAAAVTTTPLQQGKITGAWFTSKSADHVTMLYFHGGGYSFYPQAYSNIIALITLAARTKTFALDYSLAPEHRFPKQLDEALDAYRWMLKSGVDPNDLVIAGDSAGANLTLALLLATRDSKLPLPALAIALSPPTDFETERHSMVNNQDSDWIQKDMLVKWADWFCAPSERRNPLISPLFADLRGLSPIYIQAGTGEILFDGIQAFVDEAELQGAPVVLDTWLDMNHDFQIFGPYMPQSAEALRRIGQVVDSRVREPKKVVSG
jgi:monoterpene epsilon-lactone hydrolase